ncbi:MAG: methylenetetrahydrofolate reductase, partial [Dehalococcoidia bacterium]|nr:methylenetetrahydrofolate reductase [Dehalococcoidia bacterium]
MKADSKLADRIKEGKFIITAEYAPRTGTDAAVIRECAANLTDGITAVNVADNHYGIAMSSLAASVGLINSGIEPVYQIVTRDRNRIALQSDLLGSAYLGIKNVLCLSGYHQKLTGNEDSSNVFDMDSIQLVATVKKMNEGFLLNGTEINGEFSMLMGAVANPFLQPIELNLLRLKKKIAAGAEFIQTQAIFDTDAFASWLAAARDKGLTDMTAILAGVLPLTGADKALRLKEQFTDMVIPDALISRLKSAGDEAAQLKEGIAICSEIVQKIKNIPGLRGIHIMSGGNERFVP